MKYVVCLVLALSPWVLAQNPSIRIIDQDCTSDDTFFMVQARVYNSQGRPVTCEYKYSDLAGRTFPTLTLQPDSEDDTLFWGFIPGKPNKNGVTSGVLEYTVRIESAFGEVFSETSATQVTGSCLFNPSLNVRQLDAKAQLENQLTTAQKTRQDIRRDKTKKRKRKYYLIGGAVVAAGAGLATRSKKDPFPGVTETISISLTANDDNNLQFIAEPIQTTVTIRQGLETAATEFTVDFCLSGDPQPVLTVFNIRLSFESQFIGQINISSASITQRPMGTIPLGNEDIQVIGVTGPTINLNLTANYTNAFIFDEDLRCPNNYTLSITGSVVRN